MTTVYCVPPAGAGMSFYRSYAGRHEQFELVGVDLPGHESRLSEPLSEDVADLGRDVVKGIVTANPSEPIVVFGHSFGAIVAWQVVRFLPADLRDRAVLVVSGAAAPTLPRPVVSHLDDVALVDAVRKLTGYYHPAYDNEELRELLLPALRADMAALERIPSIDRRLDVPVLVLRGSKDHLVAREHAAGWSEVTSQPIRLREVPGGHMYLAEETAPLLEQLHDVLTGVPGSSDPAPVKHS